MALMSQSGPSYGMHSEVIKRKGGCNNVVNNMGIFKRNEISLGFSSSSRSSPKGIQGLHLDCTGAGSRRGHRLTVAASPPTEDIVTATEPLTKEDLVGYLASGCKTKEKWRFTF